MKNDENKKEERENECEKTKGSRPAVEDAAKTKKKRIINNIVYCIHRYNNDNNVYKKRPMLISNDVIRQRYSVWNQKYTKITKHESRCEIGCFAALGIERFQFFHRIIIIVFF